MADPSRTTFSKGQRRPQISKDSEEFKEELREDLFSSLSDIPLDELPASGTRNRVERGNWTRRIAGFSSEVPLPYKESSVYSHIQRYAQTINTSDSKRCRALASSTSAPCAQNRTAQKQKQDEMWEEKLRIKRAMRSSRPATSPGAVSSQEGRNEREKIGPLGHGELGTAIGNGEYAHQPNKGDTSLRPQHSLLGGPFRPVLPEVEVFGEPNEFLNEAVQEVVGGRSDKSADMQVLANAVQTHVSPPAEAPDPLIPAPETETSLDEPHHSAHGEDNESSPSRLNGDDQQDISDEADVHVDIPVAQPVTLEDEDDVSHNDRNEDIDQRVANNILGDQDRIRDILPDLTIAVPVPDESRGEDWDELDKRKIQRCICKNRCKSFVLALFLGGIAVGVTVAVLSSGSGEDGSTRGFDPSSVPTHSPTEIFVATHTESPTSRRTNRPLSQTETVYAEALSSISSLDKLGNSNLPQGQAFDFIVGEDGKWANPELKPDKVRQRFSLATLFFSTGGKAAKSEEGGGAWGTWSNRFGFLTDADDCDWNGTDLQGYVKGVSVCDKDGHVARLELSQNGLAGSLPSEIQALPLMTQLLLNNNQMTGKLPSSIGTLVQLQSLSLEDNRFTGTIPSEMSNMTSLRKLTIFVPFALAKTSFSKH
uniref:L domain-like protein n=1 Tax=Odontella aurita TaxID=265563 RepID=A0A7S4JWZ6_9STRA|mmetsp:Transcript_56214/g.168295  ORF Transcript_56214/g.168295 Transcript_56214/m.168295 type:complete len:651 (+) Transcript_56214:141-2093(+)